MSLNLGRPLASGDWVELSNQACNELNLTTSGPYRVSRIDKEMDSQFRWRVVVQIQVPYLGEYRVFENHVRAVNPPKVTLLDKELATREPWQDRRDANLRGVFKRERL